MSKLINFIYYHLKEHIYDAKTNSGFLENTIKNKRKNSTEIQTRPYTKKTRTSLNDTIQLKNIEEINNKIIFMKNKVININSDKEEVVLAMQETHSHRRDWILNKSPTIEEILAKFPKFKEMPFLVNFYSFI